MYNQSMRLIAYLTIGGFMTNAQLRKLSFYAKEEALQFACLLEVGTHACKEEMRFSVMPGKIAYHVVRERFIKKYGYWQIA
jgi:hypothetical protein